MESILIPLNIEQLICTNLYTIIVIKYLEKHSCSIYTEPYLGESIISDLSKLRKNDNKNFDLLNLLFLSLNITLSKVVIVDVKNNHCMVKLLLKQHLNEFYEHFIEIDSHLVDCLKIIIKNNLPLYCTKNVKDKLWQNV